MSHLRRFRIRSDGWKSAESASIRHTGTCPVSIDPICSGMPFRCSVFIIDTNYRIRCNNMDESHCHPCMLSSVRAKVTLGTAQLSPLRIVLIALQQRCFTRNLFVILRNLLHDEGYDATGHTAISFTGYPVQREDPGFTVATSWAKMKPRARDCEI